MRVGLSLFSLVLVVSSPVAAQGDPSDDAPDALALPPPLDEDAADGPPGVAPPPPRAGPQDPSDERAPATDDDASVARIAGPSVVRVRARLTDGRVRHASGVFIGPREVATTYTALKGAEVGEIDLGGDPRPFTIDGVVVVDEIRDLAVVLLREQDVGSRPIALAEGPPPVGDPVWTIAFPQRHTTSRPEVIAGRSKPPTRRGTLLSDHAPDKGIPGGALVDGQGALIGVLLPGRGPGGTTRAAHIDDLRDLLAHRHKPVRLRNLERFLAEDAAGGVYGESYVDDGYAAGDGSYADLEDEGGAATRRRRSSEDRRARRSSGTSSNNNNNVACLIGGCFFGPPIAMGVGVLGAMAGVCAIYGCFALAFVATTAARIGVVMASLGAITALIAGVVATASLVAAARPGLSPGLGATSALVLAGGAGTLALAGGALATGGLALAWARSDASEEGAPATASAEQPPREARPHRQDLSGAY